MPLTGPDRPDWLQPLSDPRNEAILSAAFDLFCERGLHGVSMQEVAAAAKVSKETLYARFDSKEGLIYALMAWGAELSAPKPDEYLKLAETDSRAALDAYAIQILKLIMRPEAIDVSRIVLGEASRMPDVARFFFDCTCTAGARNFAPLLRRLIDDGHIAETSDAVMSEIFLGLLRGNLHHSVCLGVRPIPNDEEIEAYARRAMAWLVRALAPAGAR